MNRRTLLAASVSLAMSSAGCLSEYMDTDRGTTGDSDGYADEFPDEVEIDIRGSIDSPRDLGVEIELENRVLTTHRPREYLWLTLTNDTDESITASADDGWFPKQWILRPDEYRPAIYLDRIDGTVDTISPGGHESMKYEFALNTPKLGRRFEGTKSIEYAYGGVAEDAVSTLVFTSDILSYDERSS